MSDLVFLEPNKIDSEPFTTSEAITAGAQVQQRSIDHLRMMHRTDFEEFGVLRFEMRKPPEGSKGGRPELIYHLNEEQATFLLTYLKNTQPVREFKRNLVRQFYAMRNEHMQWRWASAWTSCRQPIARQLKGGDPIMPRINPLTPEARMNQQLLATIDKYKRLAGIKRYGDLGPRMGRSATTANCRLKAPGTFTLDELRRLVRSLHIPPEDLLLAFYEKK